MCGGVNGLQGLPGRVPQGPDEALEQGAQEVQRAPEHSKLRTFFKYITCGISELFMGGRITAAQPPARRVMPAVPEVENAAPNRANDVLKAALQRNKLPEAFEQVQKAVYDKVLQRFGNFLRNASNPAAKPAMSPGSKINIMTAVKNALLPQIEQGDHVFSPEEVGCLFEKEATRELLDIVVGKKCCQRAEDKGFIIEHSLIGRRVMGPLLLTSSEVKAKIGAVRTPADVLELVAFVETKFDRELQDRQTLSKKFQEVKDQALTTLMTEGKVARETAEKYFENLSAADYCHVLDAKYRDPQTGYFKEGAVDCIKKELAERIKDKIAGPVVVLKELDTLGLPKDPLTGLPKAPLTGLQLAALDKTGLKNVEVVRFAKEVAQNMDASGIVEALKAPVPNALDIAKMLGEQLTEAYKKLSSSLPKLVDKFREFSADDYASVFGLVSAVFMNEHSDLVELIKNHLGVFAVAGHQVRIDAGQGMNIEDVPAHVHAFVIYFMQNPEPVGMAAKYEALREGCDIVAVLQKDGVSKQTDGQTMAALSAVLTDRQEALEQRFGDELPNLPNLLNLLNLPAWRAVKKSVIDRAMAGEVVTPETVADAYEKEALHLVVKKALRSTVQKAASGVGFAGEIDLHGFAAGPALDGVTNSQQLAAKMDDLKLLVQQEVMLQKALADESARFQDDLCEKLAQGCGKTKDEIKALAGEGILERLQSRWQALIQSEPRSEGKGIIGQEGIASIKVALREAAEAILQERQTAWNGLDALEPSVKAGFQEAVLQGVTLERIRAFSKIVQGVDVGRLQAGLGDGLKNAGGCLAMLRDVMQQAQASLKKLVGELESKDLQLLTQALVRKAPKIGKLLADHVDDAAHLLLQARQDVLTNMVVQDEALKQMVLDFVTQASGQAVRDHASSLEANQPLLSMLESGAPSNELRSALNNQVQRLRSRFGEGWVSADWPLSGGAAWIRTKQVIDRRAAESNDLLTEEDVVREYVRQAQLVILEARMTKRTQAFLETNGLSLMDSVPTMVHKVTSHRQEVMNEVLRVRSPDDFDKLVMDLKDVFRTEVMNQNTGFVLREVAFRSIREKFAKDSGIPKELVERELTMSSFKAKCQDIFDKAERDKQSGNLVLGAMQVVQSQIQGLEQTFFAGKLQFVEKISKEKDLSPQAKSFLQKNVLQVPNSDHPDLLEKMKASIQGIDVKPLVDLLKAGDEGLSTRFQAELMPLMRKMGELFVVAAGADADQDILVPVFLVTLLLDRNSDLMRAIEEKAQMLAPALNQIYARLDAVNLTNEDARALKLCTALFQNALLPKLVDQVHQIQ